MLFLSFQRMTSISFLKFGPGCTETIQDFGTIIWPKLSTHYLFPSNQNKFNFILENYVPRSKTMPLSHSPLLLGVVSEMY